MPREQLLGLVADVERLLAAGASAAVGHDGLSRRGRTLRELGQKVAALLPVADAVERVTSSSPREVGRAFLDLVVMARQLRGSLAGTGPEGPLHILSSSDSWQTPMPTRDVYSAHEALTTDTWSSALHGAVQYEVTGDLRLVPSALAALESNKSNLSELVADRVLPALGRGVLPDLLAKLDLKGKRADARRLWTICKIDPKIGAELCHKGLKEGSRPVKVQALECLPDVGQPGEAEKIGLETWWENKNPDMHLAALRALRKATGDEALEVLIQALLTGKNGNIIRTAQEVLAELPHPKTTERLLRELEQRLAALPPPAAKPKKGSAAERNFAAEILCYPIEALSARKDVHGQFGDKILDLFNRVLEKNDEFLRGAVIKALGEIRAPAQKLLPRILEQVKLGNAFANFERVFANIEPEGTTSIPALIELLKEREARPRANALQGLMGYGSKARAAEPLVTMLLQDRDGLVMHLAERTLDALQGGA